jgi:serine-protein kinase ATM
MYARFEREYSLKAIDSQDYDDFSEVFDELRLILVAMVRNGNQAVNSRADNDNDGFAPIVATQGSATHHLNPTTQMPASGSMRRFLETIVVLLASAPSFSSMDKRLKDEAELTDILLNVNEESFLLLGPAYFRCVRRKMITIQPSQMEALLSKLEPMLAEYSYARNESLLLLVVDFLMSTFQLWTSPHIAVTEVGRQVRVLCHWFGSALAGGKVRPWRVRDRFIIFLDRYLSHDPLQAVWYMTSDEDAEEGSSADLAYELQPSVLLMSFGADPDIRVRIRAATVNPHLISVGQVAGADPMATYREIQGYLSKDTNECVKLYVMA